MPQDTFIIWWILTFVALLLLAGFVGWKTNNNVLWILVDGRGRYSLTHFQIVLWTLLILSSMLAVLISKGFDPTQIVIPPELLGLMGISAGSGILTTGVKATKDTSGSTARIAKRGAFKLSNGKIRIISAKFSQIWLEEEGDLADRVISITKYQNFIFTLVIVAFYISIAIKQATLPALPESVVWLIGISHAGYVGGKVPNKA